MKNNICLLIFSLFTIVLNVNGQKVNKKSALAVPNLRKFDDRKIHFGFSFGFNSSTFKT